MAETKIRSKLEILNDTLDELDEKLEPMLAQSLPETLAGLETIQQAKLQVDIPYIVYDLIFIYLKTRGIDPKTHPVIAELDGVRQYFDKIKKAEEPETRKTVVDKGAANRFIKHAISQIKLQRPPDDDEAGPSHIRFGEGSDVRVPVKVTSKMEARAQYEKELKELGDEEDDLMVFEDEAGPATPAPTLASSKSKGKEKAMGSAEGDSVAPTAGEKRRRPPMDAFAGYGDTLAAADVPADSNSGQSTPMTASDTGSASKDQKKTAKKARRKAKRMFST